MLTWSTSPGQSLLTLARPKWQLQRSAGSLAAVRQGIQLQRPAAVFQVRRQAPKPAASGSGSTGQPAGRPEGQQPAAPFSPPNRSVQQQQQVRERWQQSYNQVLAFQQAHGRLPRTKASKAGPLLDGEGKLGRWCVVQRRRGNGSTGQPLSAEEEAALQAIPGWNCVRKDWWQWLWDVEVFVAQHERLPRQIGSKSQLYVPREKELGIWCHHQRQRCKGREQPPLSPEQEAALATIPGWFWEQYQRQDWEQQRQRVVAFQQQHGKLPRQQGSSTQPLQENERRLGRWCNTQRQRCKGREQPPLSPEQEAALATIPGWFWEQYQRQDWEQQFQRVVAFQQQHGRLPGQHGSSSQPSVESERGLKSWCSTQRQRYRGQQQQPLSPAQEAALEAIPGWYWEKRQMLPWELQYQRVVAFQQQHGRLPRQQGSSSQPLVENEGRLGCVGQQPAAALEGPPAATAVA